MEKQATGRQVLHLGLVFEDHERDDVAFRGDEAFVVEGVGYGRAVGAGFGVEPILRLPLPDQQL